MPGWLKLSDLKAEMGIEPDDKRDDAQLETVLDAAITFVERVRHGQFDFMDDPLSDLPAPTADLKLGTLMLARRWHPRRRSPDGLVQMAEMGSARVSSFDPDIDRLLRLGRHARPVVG
jgi:hypothetical protein